MARDINLRQIEAFKAVIENGTISRAALMFNISQPAMSKIIAHLEEDTGLVLFDRVKGRLAPTAQGMRLYEEIERIFAGVRQVENAVDTIKREQQGRLAIGVMPALSGTFARRATMALLQRQPDVFCSVQARSSEWIVDWLVTRKLDVGIVSARVDNPLVETEPLFEHPLVCIMPEGHALAERKVITAEHLNNEPFVAFNADSYGGRQVTTMFEQTGMHANVVLVASSAPTICEFVTAGLGVSLVHPLMVSGWERELTIRPFEPEIRQEFRICRSRGSRNARLVQDYVDAMLETASTIYDEVVGSA